MAKSQHYLLFLFLSFYLYDIMKINENELNEYNEILNWLMKYKWTSMNVIYGIKVLSTKTQQTIIKTMMIQTMIIISTKTSQNRNTVIYVCVCFLFVWYFANILRRVRSVFKYGREGFKFIMAICGCIVLLFTTAACAGWKTTAEYIKSYVNKETVIILSVWFLFL